MEMHELHSVGCSPWPLGVFGNHINQELREQHEKPYLLGKHKEKDGIA
jgi:hypothetical protein